MGCNDAATKVNVGPFGRVDLLRCLLDADFLGRMGRCSFHGSLWRIVAFCNLYILGHVHQHRARSAGLCQNESLPNGVSQLIHRAYEVVVLGDG